VEALFTGQAKVLTGAEGPLFLHLTLPDPKQTMENET
jgi:hypothetical protein